MVSKKYSAKFKRDTVEEFIELKKEYPKLSKTEFAIRKGIPDSTFVDWVLKYEREGIGFCNVTNEIKKLDEVEVIDVDVKSQNLVRKIDDESYPFTQNKVRLKYNGAVIEFDESLLERVLSILKTW